ncbi:MAG TPA: tetratricopeptide repeat protein [Streptosporangiaceae bacterium]
MDNQGLAEHRTILLVDVEGFGDPRRTTVHQLAIRDGLYRVLRQAMRAAGVPLDECRHEDRGDGVFVLAPARMPKAPFVEALPSALVAALREHNVGKPAEQRIRLRMALHAGEVVFDGNGAIAPSVNLGFRLLDAPPLKTALAESPGVLALITSGWFFDDVVRNSDSAHPATFRPVRVSVKETSTVGWICLPDQPYLPDPAHLTTPPPEQHAGPVPRQLPGAPRTFTGRTKELARLTAALDGRAGRSGPVVISAIGGAGGIGKTWLALHWAHRYADRFPDGHLFVDLGGYSPVGEPTSPRAALHGFLVALGADLGELPADLDAQVALYRSMMHGRRMLIVLDNARATDQVIPLLPGSATCTVLVTSRDRLTGLIANHGARPLAVDVLPDDEARALLAAHLDPDRLAAEPDAVADVMRLCGGWPLALAIVGAWAAVHPQLPLHALAEELNDHATRLDGLDLGEMSLNLRAVFSASYDALPPDAATLFCLLGLAPGPDISEAAAGSLAGLDKSTLRRLLRRLENAHLIARPRPSRYQLHDLLRIYAVSQANHQQPDGGIDTGLRRLLDFYLHTAYAADQILDPHRESVELNPPVPGCHPLPLRDEVEALAWLDAEHPCLLAAQRLAGDRHWHALVWRLAPILHTYHWRRGLLLDQVAIAQAGLTAAVTHVGDPHVQAQAHRLLAEACALANRHSEALHHLGEALALAERAGDLQSQAHTHRVFAWAWGEQEKTQSALDHAVRSLELFQALDNEEWEARGLNQTAWYSAQLSHYEVAGRYCEAALVLHRRHDNRNGEGLSLSIRAFLAWADGRNAAGLEYGQEALVLLRDIGNTYHAADVLRLLGHIHLTLGRHDQARTALQEARELYQAQHRTKNADRVQHELDELATAEGEHHGAG